MSARSGRYISIRNRAVPFGRYLYEAYEAYTVQSSIVIDCRALCRKDDAFYY